MRKFFLAEIDGSDQLFNSAYVARVKVDGEGLAITLMDGSTVLTRTYDLPGLISNVLDDDVVTPE